MSFLDSDGSLLNRISWKVDKSAFCLNAVTSKDTTILEPCFKTNGLLIGRLKLKSLLREIYNSNGNASGASVFFEPGILTVTESYRGSSKYGFVIRPGLEKNLYSWFFRTNSGQVSGGLAQTGLSPVIENGLFRLESDIALCAGNTAGKAGSVWFNNRPLIPEQPVLTPVFELRVGFSDTENMGRRMLLPPHDDFGVSFSILSAYSIPMYTETGGFVRLFSCLGWEFFNIRGSLMYADENYLCPGGELSRNNCIAGISAFSLLTANAFRIEMGTDYNWFLRCRDVVPSRFIGQKYKLESFIKLCAEETYIKLNASFGRSFEDTGAILDDINCALSANICAGPFILFADYDIEDEGKDGYWKEPLDSAGAGIKYQNENLNISLNCKWSEYISLKAGMNLSLGASRLTAEIAADEERQIEFQISLNTKK